MKHILVTSYHSYKDPIVYGLLLKYLIRFQELERGVRFHYITFEQENFRLSAKEIKLEKQLLEEKGIYWHPLKYHSGGLSIILKKLFDFTNLLVSLLFIRIKFRPRYVIGFTSISGIFAFLSGKFLGMSSLVLNMEPHATYMSDFGIWRTTSLKYKTLNWLEWMTIKNCSHLFLPTKAFYRVAKNLRADKPSYFLPTGINVNQRNFLPEERERLRNEKGFKNDDLVLIYLGKFGGIYYSAEDFAEKFKDVLNAENSVKVWIITPDNIQNVEEQMTSYIPKNKLIVDGKIPFEKINSYLSAADLGLFLVPSHSSQRYRCPIKTADYWGCGLPILITHGVSDDYIISRKYHVGKSITENVKYDEHIKEYESQGRLIEETNRVVEKFRDLNKTVSYLRSIIID
ncbi:MAG: hypothetical protein ABJP45_15545 [Cyclobacteriaceae bacterium]